MHPDLELLLTLQGIDYDIGELERSKDYIPDMMSNLRGELERKENALAADNEELTQLALSQKNAELEVSSKQEDLKRYQSQMMSIKTNKEYDALVTEIDSIKRTIKEREDQILSWEERIEEIKSTLDEQEGGLGEIKATNTKQIASLQKRMDSVGDKVAGHIAERDRIVTKVSRPSMSIYERVRRGKGNSTLVSIKKRACGGCFKAVPPQRLQEIRRGDRVICCDNCGRMLIAEEVSK